MTPSVHRAKRVTAAVRAVERAPLPPATSFIFPPRSLCLPTYPRPDADTVLTSSIVSDGDLQFETNPPSDLAEPVERCPRSWLSFFGRYCALEDAISIGRSHLEKKMVANRSFYEYNFQSYVLTLLVK